MSILEENWLPMSAILLLIGLGGIGQWIRQGHGRIRRHYFFLGLELTLAALGAQAAFLTLDKSVPDKEIDAYVASVNISYVFSLTTLLTFIFVAFAHDHHRRRGNRLTKRASAEQRRLTRREQAPEWVFGIATNLLGLLLLFGFVALVGDSV